MNMGWERILPLKFTIILDCGEIIGNSFIINHCDINSQITHPRFTLLLHLCKIAYGNGHGYGFVYLMYLLSKAMYVKCIVRKSLKLIQGVKYFETEGLLEYHS